MIQFALILVATFMILTGVFTTLPVIGTMLLGSLFITIGFICVFLYQDQDIEQHSKDMWKNGKVFVNTTYKDIKTKIKPKK
jgi:flagellar biosynthesis component FlhA